MLSLIGHYSFEDLTPEDQQDEHIEESLILSNTDEHDDNSTTGLVLEDTKNSVNVTNYEYDIMNLLGHYSFEDTSNISEINQSQQENIIEEPSVQEIEEQSYNNIN